MARQPKNKPDPESIDPSKPLKNDQWELFCHHYVANGFNATLALGQAGMAPHRQSANRMLNRPEIENRVNYLKTQVCEELGYSAKEFFLSLLEQYNADFSAIHNDDGSILPISEWPEVWRKYVGSIEVASTQDGGTITKIKGMDKSKLADMIGKYREIAAFNESKTVDHVSSDGSMTPKTLDDFYKINAPESDS